jgi:hypothetical protein
LDRMLTYKGKALLTMARPKGRRGSRLGTSLLRMSRGRGQKRIPFTPAVAIDGKRRGDREVGSNRFQIVIGRAGCQDGHGDIGDARGYGTNNLALSRDCLEVSVR